jgi:hypothetical protein
MLNDFRITVDYLCVQFNAYDHDPVMVQATAALFEVSVNTVFIVL